MLVLWLKIVPIRPNVMLLFEKSRHGPSTWQYCLFHVLICMIRGEGQLEPLVLSSPHQHTTIHCGALQWSEGTRDIKKVGGMITLLSGKFLQSRKIPLSRLTKFQGIIYFIQGLNFARNLQFKSQGDPLSNFTGPIWSPLHEKGNKITIIRKKFNGLI